jgi:phosphopantothenate synthetase
MQLSIDITLNNLLSLISNMNVTQIEEIKNKIIEKKLYFQNFKVDSVENIVNDFKKEDYSNDFLKDLEEGLKKSSPYNGN